MEKINVVRSKLSAYRHKLGLDEGLLEKFSSIKIEEDVKQINELAYKEYYDECVNLAYNKLVNEYRKRRLINVDYIVDKKIIKKFSLIYDVDFDDLNNKFKDRTYAKSTNNH